MQKRKSHNKSRAGCQNCKRKHVKCDEQGPPCANCIARETADTCTYSKDNRPRPSGRGSGSPAQDVQSSASSLQLRSRSLSQSPIDLTYGTRHLLEMQLMHRWSTSTYKSFCGVPEDERYMQMELPVYALRHDYLLQGIMAMAALELATASATTYTGDALSLNTLTTDYARAAMEYYDRASSLFRALLRNASRNITQDTFHCIFMFSNFVTSFNMGLPQRLCMPSEAEKKQLQTQTSLDRAPMLMQMVISSGKIFAGRPEWILTSPLGPSILKSVMLMQVPAPKLDNDTEAALARVESVIAGYTGVNSSIASADTTVVIPASESMLASTQRDLYYRSVMALRRCYNEDLKDTIKAYCTAFPSIVGADFISAVRDLDSVALFVLMHWAVLLDKLSKTCWFVGSLGSELVLDISSTLLLRCPEDVDVLQWREGIEWTRRRVGLTGTG